MKKKSLIIIIIFSLQILCLTACSTENGSDSQLVGNNGDNSPSNTGNLSNNSDIESDKDGNENENDPEYLEKNWTNSSHADSYVQDNSGNNNRCAQCHAPTNWMPSMDEMPESCFSCKFEINDPDPYISEEDWAHIPCRTCHKLDKKDNVLPEIFWLEIAQIDEYASVATTDELCQKCHIPTNKFVGHPGTIVGGAHEEYQCVGCHDAHSNTASCGATECHDLNVAADPPIEGHDEDHQNVSCAACHDSGDYEVGPMDEGQWITYITDSENMDELYPFTSHNIVLEVVCDRCHFPDNPWGLSGEIVQE